MSPLMYETETVTIKRRKCWMIEGTWSGYRSNQQRVYHREYTHDLNRVEAIRSLGSIGYTDNTWLYLSVSDVTGQHWRKRPPAINGYRSLIDKCLQEKKHMVADLSRKQP